MQLWTKHISWKTPTTTHMDHQELPNHQILTVPNTCYSSTNLSNLTHTWHTYILLSHAQLQWWPPSIGQRLIYTTSVSLLYPLIVVFSFNDNTISSKLFFKILVKLAENRCNPKKDRLGHLYPILLKVEYKASSGAWVHSLYIDLW